MLLQATLNGPLTKDDHSAVPVTLEELAADAAACVAAGARAFHVHPRDASGAESLDARVVDRVAAAVREPHGMPVGVTTGAWIEPDLQRRLALVREWTQPDFTSVNLSEPGAVEVMQALLETRTGIEAGVWTVADAELLVRSGLADRVTRVMIEPVEVSRADAVPLVERHPRRPGPGRGPGAAAAARRRRGHLDPDRGRDPPRHRHPRRLRGHRPAAGRPARRQQRRASPGRPRPRRWRVVHKKLADQGLSVASSSMRLGMTGLSAAGSGHRRAFVR